MIGLKRRPRVVQAALIWTAAAGLVYSQTPQRRAGIAITELSESFEKLAQMTSRAVVQINVSGYALAPESDGNVAALTREHGVGSGVVLSPDGYIVTNAHVVRNAQKISVTFHSREALPAKEDSATAVSAQLIGLDRETDLAVLKVDRTGLPSLMLGDSDKVRQGQLVVAFGSPLGLSNSMTMGVVSAPERQLREEDFMEYIQTDTPINPGNSGGPLVDVTGAVIGINTMILTQSGGSEGVGLAIPSNLVRTVFDEIKTHGHVHRGLIGANAQTITPTLAEGLNLGKQSGVLITDLAPGGPGDKGGLQIGDVVTKMDHSPLRSARQLALAVFRAKEGDQLHFDVVREGKEFAADVSVAERTDSADTLAGIANPKDSLIPQLGILGLTIDKTAAAMIPDLRKPSGVAVAALAHEPTAWTSQLQAGDVIHELNASPVESLDFLREKLAAIPAGGAVVLQIERDSVMQYLAFRAE
jgi:serine protease Do